MAKGRASPKGNRKAKRAVGLVCHMVANTVETRRVEAKESQSTRERKETKGSTKESSRKAKGMVVEAIATYVVFVEVMATGEMNECTIKSNVNQVNGAGNSGGVQGAPNDTASTTGSTRRASTASTTSQSLSSGSMSVRLVKMYHEAGGRMEPTLSKRV